jgi:hypothetical protein
MMAVAVLVLLGACAPGVSWVKPDAGPAQAAADEKQCNGIAANEASLEMMSSHPLYPPETDTLYALSGGDASGHGPKPSYSREGARQYELASYCMQQRGYRLVQTAPKPVG